jgi:SAM-dependent methyltransferase
MRRGMVLGGWVVMKAEEQLTDAYYRRRGLHTLGRDWELHGHGSASNGYAPTAWRPLRQVFRNIRVGSHDVLLDYGCGKGRGVIWAAANFRCKRIIGLELDEQLHAEAKANLERWSGPFLCKDVTFVQGDATEYDVPDDVTIVFMANPFTGDVFDKVVAKIQESAARRPRRLEIIYYHPRMHDALVAAGFSIERQKLSPPCEWTIYRYSTQNTSLGSAKTAYS